jgi:hypothetical protein
VQREAYTQYLQDMSKYVCVCVCVCVHQSGGYSKIRYIDSCLLERVERWWKAKGGVEMNEEVG